MAKTSPTQRTLKRLRESGEFPLVQIVERWNAFARGRQDLFGIIDLLAIDTKGNTVGIQVTTTIPHLRNANWTILVEGWAKVGNRWQNKIIDLS